MDYELNHIDEFLSDKLTRFEEKPDESALEGIFAQLPPTAGHPIDNALYHHLAQAEFQPELYAPYIPLHPIDTGLSNTLQHLDVQPADTWETIAGQLPQKKKKKRVIFYWLMPLLITLTSAIVYTSIHSDKTNNQITEGIIKGVRKSVFNFNSESILSNNGDRLSEIPAIAHPSKVSPGLAKLRRIQKSLNDPNRKRFLFESIDALYDAPAMEISSGMTIHPVTPIVVSTSPDAIAFIPAPAHSSSIKKRLSPFSITLTAGAIDEHTINDKISSDKVHRDAAALFGDASGKNNKGFIFNLQFGYRLLPRITLKSGINIIQTKVSQSIHYTYTDIPIYDSATGNIFGYYKRSANNSTQLNENSTVTNTTINAPLQIGYQLFEFKRLAVWVEGGTNINLKAKLNSDLFNFKNEKLGHAQKTKAMLFSPNMAFSIRYRYLPNLHLMAQLQLNYQQKKYYIDSYHFTKTEMSPMINFGIIYHPLIRKK